MLRRFLLSQCCLFWLLLASAFAEAELYYLAYDGEYWQVYEMQEFLVGNAKSTKVRQLTTSKYDKNVISMFPGGRAILINSSQGKFYKLDLSSGKEVLMPFPYRNIFDARLSPDGLWITFSYSASGNPDDSAIWVASLDAKSMTKLTNMAGLQHSPRWVDSETIVFLTNHFSSENGVWLVNRDKSSIRQLVSNAVRNFDAVPSDKGQIVFSSRMGGKYALWLAEMGKKPRQISHSDFVAKYPAYLEDSDEYVFVSSRGSEGALNLWKADSGFKSLHQLTKHERGARDPIWKN